MTTDEQKAYARGYAAGKRRTDAELEKLRKLHDDMFRKEADRRDAFFCAALTGLIIKGTWQLDGKPVASSDDYVRLAKIFANKSMERMR